MKKFFPLIFIILFSTSAFSQSIYKLGSPNGIVKSLGLLTADTGIRVTYYLDTPATGGARYYGSLIVTGADSTKLWWYSKRWNIITDNHTTGTFIPYSDTLTKIVTLKRLHDSLNGKQDTLGFTPPYVYNITDPQYGANGTDTLDDVPSIQDAVNASLGFEHVGFNSISGIDTIRQVTRNYIGGDIYFPNGIYYWRRGLVKSVVHLMLDGSTVVASVNSQVYIPYFADYDTSKLNPATIRFIGESAPLPSLETPTRDINRRRWTAGMQNISTINHDGSTHPAMLSSVAGDAVFATLYPNIIYAITKNFWVTSHYDDTGGTQLCGIDFQYALDSWFEDTKADAFVSGANTIRPTHEVYGLRLNNSNYGTVNGMTRCMATGYTFGGVIGSQAAIDNFNTFMCWSGLEQLGAVHPTVYNNKGIMSQWNAWSITTGYIQDPFASDVAMVSGLISEERYCVPGKWYTYQGEIKDSLSRLRGYVTLETRNLGSGCAAGVGLNSYILQGATKLYIKLSDTNTSTINGNAFVQDLSGNVGIGIGVPTARLDVRGSITPIGLFKYTGSSNMEFRIDGANGFNTNITLRENGNDRWYISNIGSNDHFAITNGAGTEKFTILANESQFNSNLTTAGTDNYDVNRASSYTSLSKVDKNYVDSTHNTTTNIVSTSATPFSATTNNASSATVTFDASNALSQMAMYVRNDRTTTFNSYGGLMIGGSTNVGSSLFGLSRRDKVFVFSDGSNSTGMAIGTLTNDSVIIGTNNTIRMTFTGGGNIGIGSTTSSARLHLPAGTPTASTAPLKFTAGVRLTTPEAGAMEYDSLLFFTPTTVRRPVYLAGYNTQSGTTYTIVTADFGKVVGMTNVAARTITLPAASSIPAGYPVNIKDEAGTALTANITINRSGSDTIDGATSYTININYQSIEIYSDGSSKYYLK